jgi:hypothetical protein
VDEAPASGAEGSVSGEADASAGVAGADASVDGARAAFDEAPPVDAVRGRADAAGDALAVDRVDVVADVAELAASAVALRAPVRGDPVPAASAFDPAERSAKATGVNVSLEGLTTPWAPMVITPHCTVRQSVVTTAPLASADWKVGPGTTMDVDQLPSAPMRPPLAELAVSEPGKDTNLS